ncbi:hypothetical protein DYB32_005550 [Aphanomyces invadans]|uniref:Uncharacterized protein n=1 Tax=Aphanomyces invadans TaxID=157072 RepID=A0A418AU98_9STRA|nr:hypothetical protein DYB32_005550 [Aphanomyces invadans]
MSTLLLADKERNKRVNKVEKLHQKAIYLSKKIDKAQWKQVLFGNDSEKLREWQKEEASINTKIANVRADMLKKIQNPLELFPAVQVAWHAAKFGLLHLLQAHVRTPGALEYRELSSQTTVLHVAAYFGNLDCVQFLAQANADVNATNSHGSTPLHCAAEQHHAEVVAFLLSLPQVDPYLRNTAGLLPTHIVRKGASLLGDKYGRFAKCSRALDAVGFDSVPS